MPKKRPKKLPKKPKAKVYIDGANMFYAQKKLGWMFDWKKVYQHLKKEYEIEEIRFYFASKKRDRKTKKFLLALKKLGFTPVTKALKRIQVENDKWAYKANFDVEMTADILLDEEEYDVFILFSGDSDFEYLVKILKKLGKRVFIYASRKTLSWELKLVATRYFFLEDIKRKIYRKKWGLDK
ncbi:NYN domain-containing protein [Patescibacteria group bacterium]|nr:NYN domain-containing protein [Patescibacteria group bacterium]